MTTTQAFSDAGAFGALASGLASDATSVLNAAYGLAGDYGRDAAVTPNPAVTSETEALAAASVSRAAVAVALPALANAVLQGGDVPLAVHLVLNAVRAAMSSPADQIRACIALALTPGSTQVAVLCRRLSVVALATSAAAYQPTSYDDAQAALTRVTNAIDAEITAAGDVPDDASFKALRALRVAVSADLTARGATLAPLRNVTFAANLPALVLAAHLYGDASRDGELVRRADPVHPLFMPRSMRALAS